MLQSLMINDRNFRVKKYLSLIPCLVTKKLWLEKFLNVTELDILADAVKMLQIPQPQYNINHKVGHLFTTLKVNKK